MYHLIMHVELIPLLKKNTQDKCFIWPKDCFDIGWIYDLGLCLELKRYNSYCLSTTYIDFFCSKSDFALTYFWAAHVKNIKETEAKHLEYPHLLFVCTVEVIKNCFEKCSDQGYPWFRTNALLSVEIFDFF